MKPIPIKEAAAKLGRSVAEIEAVFNDNAYVPNKGSDGSTLVGSGAYTMLVEHFRKASMKGSK